MSFTNPFALCLLILLPAFALLGWPSRGSERRRETLSLLVRLLIVLALILSLAGVSIVRAADELAVVFLIDVSDSMSDEAVLAAESYIQQAIESMGPQDRAAVIAFGGEALVDRPMSAIPEYSPLTSIPVTTQTDLAEAMQLALALYPPGAARRMVILSDGADTISGEAASAGGEPLLETARMVRAAGVEVVVVPFSIDTGPEVMIRDVEAPGFLRQGEQFNLNITVDSNTSTRVGVRVLAGDQVVYEGSEEVDPGTETFSLVMDAGEPGFVRYRVQITAPDDTYYQNNELEAFAEVEGPPKVLLVAPPEGESLGSRGGTRPDELTPLLNALQASSFLVETALPAELPSDLVQLNEYSSVVLIDTPARDLSPRQMATLQQYVRDLGGGLAAVGGPTSYGVGGYFRTPLEETLPLEMQIKDEQRRPTLTMVFIIDHSGSMADTSSGASKVELAKEATIRSLELLSPLDRVGVIAFDESASWVVDITTLEDPGSIISAVGTIRAGGGTDIMAGLQAMANVLPDDPSTVRHVILLTDGGANPAGIPELVQRLYKEHGITLSTVGVGRDAAPFLEELAEIGGGRYHFTADPSTIPSIFTEETTLATRSYIVEETFYPQVFSSSPIIAGIQETPPLHGYVGTSAKQTAQTILISEQEDPLLAVWQYGLGRAAAFTSDATGRWARDWVGWEGFPRFWSQIIEYTLAERTPSALDLRVEAAGEEASLVVDAFRLSGDPGGERSGDYLNGYEMMANVIAPGGEVISTTLRQVAPGRYESSFKPRAEGAYLIHVTGIPGEEDGNGNAPVAATNGWVLSYSPEYRNLESDPDQLNRIALAAGGRIAGVNPREAFDHTLQVEYDRRPIWPWLLAAAAVLLPFDIAIRRLVVTRSDLRRAWNKAVVERFRREPKPAVDLPPERAPRMEALFKAKERSRESLPKEKPPEAVRAPERAPKPVPKPAAPAAPVQVRPKPAPPEERPAKREGSPGSTAAKLLEQKRKKQG